MSNKLTEKEQELLEKIEEGGIEMIKKHRVIWCYLDGKRNGCDTFDERIKQISNNEKIEVYE